MTRIRSPPPPRSTAATNPVNDARCYIDVNNNFLADSAVDVEAWIMREVTREFARLEGAAFINGVGPKQPQGMISSGLVNYYPSGNAGAVTANSIVALPFQLAAEYAKTAVSLCPVPRWPPFASSRIARADTCLTP